MHRVCSTGVSMSKCFSSCLFIYLMCICLLSLDSSTFPFPPLHLIHSHLFNPSISTSSTHPLSPPQPSFFRVRFLLLPLPFLKLNLDFIKSNLNFIKLNLNLYKSNLNFIKSKFSFKNTCGKSHSGCAPAAHWGHSCSSETCHRCCDLSLFRHENWSYSS